MKRLYGTALLACVALAVAGCGDKEPKGQVVATVDKEEITAIDLKNEMGNFSTPDPKVRRAAEMRALDQIIVRKILAQAAKKQKLDKTPEFAQQRERAEENLLVQNWQERLARAVPAVSTEEVNKFINEHPDIYGQRKVLTVDQIRMPRTVDQNVIKAMQPMKSLEEIAQLLASRNIPYQRGAAKFDAFANDPQLVAQVMKVGSDDVFVVPNGNLLMINKVTGSEVQPVSPQQASAHASQYLKAFNTRQAIERDFKASLASAREKVKYAKAYDPKLLQKAAPAPKAK